MTEPFDGPWFWLTIPFAQMLAGLIAAVLVAVCGRHRDENNSFANSRLAGAITAAITSYTFIVCIFAQFWPDEPYLPEVVERGFKGDRIAWIMVAVCIGTVLQIWGALIAPRPKTKE